LLFGFNRKRNEERLNVTTVSTKEYLIGFLRKEQDWTGTEKRFCYC
jgi:hypothetical protein